MHDLRRRIEAISDKVLDWHISVILAVVTVIVHVITMAEGLEVSSTIFTSGSLVHYPELLPLRLLRHNLIDNLSHLHTQPPLFNLATGLLLDLSPSSGAHVVNYVGVAMCSVIVLSSYLLLRELHVPKSLSTFVTLVFVVANPALMIYAAQYSVVLPSTMLLTTMGWLAARWLRTERVISGFLYGILGLVLVLLNPEFQIYWLIVISFPLAVAMRRYWQQIAVALVIPMVVLGTWYFNDLIQFNQVVTSSWTGMTLSSVTTATDSSGDIGSLVRSGSLSNTALVPAFSCLKNYGQLGHRSAHNVLALNLHEKTACQLVGNGVYQGVANLNDIRYLGISTRYWNDDVSWVALHPRQYFLNVNESVHYWSLAPQVGVVTPAVSKNFSSYLNMYSNIVQWQFQAPTTLVNLSSETRMSISAPTPSDLSWLVVVTSFLTFFALPLILIFKRRILSRAQRGAGWWMFLSTASIFVGTSFISLGQNNIYSFETSFLTVSASTVAISWFIRRPEKPTEIRSERVIV